MPVKRSRRGIDLTPEIRQAAGSVAAWVDLWGSEAEARRAWRRYAPALLRNVIGMPSALFWRFAPEVPAGLREPVPEPDPRDVLRVSIEDLPVEYREALAARDEQRAARWAWLRRKGYVTGRPERFTYEEHR